MCCPKESRSPVGWLLLAAAAAAALFWPVLVEIGRVAALIVRLALISALALAAAVLAVAVGVQLRRRARARVTQVRPVVRTDVSRLPGALAAHLDGGKVLVVLTPVDSEAGLYLLEETVGLRVAEISSPSAVPLLDGWAQAPSAAPARLARRAGGR